MLSWGTGVDLNPAKTQAAQDAVQDALAECIMDLQAVLHVIGVRSFLKSNLAAVYYAVCNVLL